MAYEQALSFLACSKHSNVHAGGIVKTDKKTGAACATNETKLGSATDPIYPVLIGKSFLRFFWLLQFVLFFV